MVCCGKWVRLLCDLWNRSLIFKSNNGRSGVILNKRVWLYLRSLHINTDRDSCHDWSRRSRRSQEEGYRTRGSIMTSLLRQNDVTTARVRRVCTGMIYLQCVLRMMLWYILLWFDTCPMMPTSLRVHCYCNKERMPMIQSPRIAGINHMYPWASYQIRNIAGWACAGNAGNVFPRHRLQRKPLVNDPGMHHGTCVTHVPWCMSGSLAPSGGENVPGIPGACAPAIFRNWQEAH